MLQFWRTILNSKASNHRQYTLANTLRLLSNTYTVSLAALFGVCACVCVRERMCMFISMRITRPLCLVSCQTFGQGQNPRDWAGGGGVLDSVVGGEQERGVRGLEGHWWTVQTDSVRGLTMAFGNTEKTQSESEWKKVQNGAFKETQTLEAESC